MNKRPTRSKAQQLIPFTLQGRPGQVAVYYGPNDDIADTFLTTVPLRSRDAEIRWLLGFRWGYREYDTPAEKPVTLLPLEITDAQAWNHHLPFLRKEFGAWRFK